MSFLNPTGVTTLWSRMINYLTGAHVKTSVVSGATDVDGALTKLQTKTGTATLTTTAKNLSGAVNELDSGLDAQSQQIDDLGPYNRLDSDSTIAALSAAQGKALDEKITSINDKINSTTIEIINGLNAVITGNVVELTYSVSDGIEVQAGSYSYVTYVPENIRPYENHTPIGVAADDAGNIGFVGIQASDGRLFIRSKTTATYNKFTLTYVKG